MDLKQGYWSNCEPGLVVSQFKKTKLMTVGFLIALLTPLLDRGSGGRVFHTEINVLN